MQQGLFSGVSKMFRRVVLVVLMLFVGISAADAAGYLCPTYRKYTSCNAGYYLNGTGVGNACVKCPSGYPNSDAGSDAITDCYSNSKSRAWTGGQISCSVANATVTCNSCSGAACSYVAYSNSAGTGDGVLKSGCSTNNANCQQTVKSFSCESTYYAKNGACALCPSGYPNSDVGSDAITDCYSNSKSRAWTGGQTACSKPTGCASATCNTCSGSACSYVAYSNSAGTGDGTVKSGCSTNSANCQQTVKSVTANANNYVSGTTCPACSTQSSLFPNSSGGSISNSYCYRSCAAKTGYTLTGGVDYYSVTDTCAYSANEYSLSYFCAEGDGEHMYMDAATYNEPYTFATAPDDVCKQRFSGFTFAGWICAQTGYDGGETITYTTAGSLTCVADWQPNNYTVSFNANGGSGGQSANVTATYSAAMPTISTTKPTRAGYVFMGWYDNATYTSGTQYYTAAGASARSYNKTSNTTLYAGWAPCTAGYYCPAGSTSVTQNKCPGLYVNSLAASDANTDCYFTTTGGKYIASKDATTQTDCEYAYYCPSTKLYYPNTGSRQSCPDPTTHKRTTFPSNYYATAIESTGLVSWSSNNKELITQCRVITWITGTRGRLYEYATYNSSTGKYDNSTSYDWSDVYAGYYLTTKSGCGTYAYYDEAKECPKNSYCPGKARVECTSSNQATVHTDTFGLNACTSLGSFYTTTASTGSTAASQCYGTTTAGKYIATANSSTQTTCEAGYACPSADVYYGSTGSRSKCTGAKYQDATGQASCKTCPTATLASATGDYGYWIGDDIHDTVTGCYAAHKTTNASGTIIGNCFADENGVYGRYCNNFNGSTCSAGYYYPGTYSFNSIDAMFSGVCVDVGSGNYFAGGAVTWNTAQVPSSCSALGGIGVSGANATYSSVSPRDTSKTCRFTAGAVTKTGCSSVVSNAVVYDGSNWGSNYYTAKAAKGYRVSSTDGANPSCTPCAAGTYQGSDNSTATTCGTCANWTYSGAGAASCTSCPTVTSGWSKVNSTGTGWDSYADCQQTQKPANCASGAVVQTATSSSAWGASSVSTALTASANYYVNGVVCSLCSSLGGGLYKTSASGNSGGASACYATTEAGKYISATSNTAQQTCPAGDWCAGGVKLNWSATGGNTDCPEGYDDGTTGYSLQSQCTMNVPGGKYVKTAKESSPSGTCVAGYAKAAHSVTYGGTSSCSECTGASYSTSDGASSCTSCPAATNNTAAINTYDYWNGGATGSHTVRSGCFVQFKNKTLDDGAMSLYHCYVDSGADTYGVNGTANSCWVNKPDLTCNGGYYNVVFNGNSAATQDTTNTTLTDLFANVCVTVGTGYWSAADSLTRTQCPANYRSGAAASAENQCVTSCGDGTYVATKNQACTSVGSGYYRAAHDVAYGATSSRSECPSGYSGSDGTRAANTNCYVGCSAKTISNGTTTVVNAKEYYSGSAYPACTFNVNCNAKYGASGNKTANPACTACAAGKYSDGGTAACTQCSNAPANSEYTGNAATNSCPWECKSGYNQTVDNQCGQFCTAGVTHIKLGNGLSIPLYSTARTAPAINIRVNDSVCYGSLAAGTTTDTTLRVKYEGSSYYAPEATE